MKTLEGNITRLHALLTTKRFGRQCRWFDSVGSTNSLAFDWADEGAGTGALVIGDFQEKGRGRFSRSWTADSGVNLMFSIVVRPDEFRPHLEVLPIGVAVAVAEGLRGVSEPHQPMIKWPNDIMLADRKVCGILVESQLPSGPNSCGGRVVVGVGINVNQEKFPGELEATATSLHRLLGRQVDRFELLAEALASLESVYEDIVRGRIEGLLRRYEASMMGIGESVRFTQTGTQTASEGTILGLDDSGGLCVRTAIGVEVLRAGEVTIRAEAGLAQTKVARLPDPPISTNR